ncbi:MAG: hypothetical protein IIA87_00990 [Nanoarchaeota archaeon]|nr:hypothetical protein [Nanoarchaeota archaeon]
MLNRTWKIVLLVIALVFVIWPGLLFNTATNWIALIAIVILLLGEFTCKSCGPSMSTTSAKSARRSARRSR